jgi:hypothetical protein
MNDKSVTAKHEPQVGDLYRDSHGIVRIMSIVDGWAMMRRPRCIPFCRFVTDIPQEYTLEAAMSRSRRKRENVMQGREMMDGLSESKERSK